MIYIKFKSLLFISLFLLFLSVGAISAADLNETHDVSRLNSDNSIVLTVNNSNGHGTFNDLQNEINNAPIGSVLDLSKDYDADSNAVIHLDKDLTIDGHGHTLNADDECYVFHSKEGNIILKNLKLINGYNKANEKGGAIHIDGTAQYTLENCDFFDNAAELDGGAIYNNVDKDLTIKNCTFTFNSAYGENGGAVYSKGSIYSYDSLFQLNTAVDGGAIFDEANVFISNCIFLSNSAENCIFLSDGEASIMDSPCYGGAICSKEKVNINNSTFNYNMAENNGGAIYAKSIDINNNLATAPFNCFFIGNNAGDGKDVSDDNGGALYATAYINAVNAVFDKNTAEVGGGAAYAENHISVRHCLFEFNQASRGSLCYGGALRCEGGVVIKNSTFNNNFAKNYGGAIYAKYIDINNNLATGPFDCFFMGNKAGDDSRTVYADDNGGALYTTDYINAVNTVFDKNTAKVDGGAAYSEYNINVRNCLFEFNQANGAVFASCYGGALRAENDATINNCTFRNNYAENKGGAVYASTVTLKNNNTFEGNSAKDHGGAIYTDKFTDDVKYAVFDDNEAQTGDGGAIYINCENSITFSQCKFINNKADDNGGAIYLDSYKSKVSLINNYFEGNSADDGQVIYNCGEYQQIRNNFWMGQTPSSDNNQITEYKFFGNEHYGDSDPIKIDFVFDVSKDDEDEIIVNVKIAYFKSDKTYCSDVIEMIPATYSVNADGMPIETKNEKRDFNTISFDFVPNYGINVVTIQYKNYTLSKQITVEKE